MAQIDHDVKALSDSVQPIVCDELAPFNSLSQILDGGDGGSEGLSASTVNIFIQEL